MGCRLPTAMATGMIVASLVAAQSFAEDVDPEAPQAPAEQTAPMAPPENPPAGSNKAPAAVLDKGETQGILGKQIFSSAGENMGRIVDVIVDRGGDPRAAIIDFGGFLGVGSRKIAVDWSALHFVPEGKSDRVVLDLTRDQVKAAPEYKEGKPVVVLGASGGAQPMPSDSPETPEP